MNLERGPEVWGNSEDLSDKELHFEGWRKKKKLPRFTMGAVGITVSSQAIEDTN